MISLTVYTAAVYYIVIRLKPDVALCWFSEHVYGIALIALAWWYLKSGKWRGKKVYTGIRQNRNPSLLFSTVKGGGIHPCP